MAPRGGEMTTLLRAIVECPPPVIGVIDGHVRAGGMGLVGACDIVVAGPRSTFWRPRPASGLLRRSSPDPAAQTPRAVRRPLLPTGETFPEPPRPSMPAWSPSRYRSPTGLRACSPAWSSHWQGITAGLAASKALDDRDNSFWLRPRRRASDAGVGLAVRSAEAHENARLLQKRPPPWAEP